MSAAARGAGAGGPILAIDTSGTRAVVALGAADGSIVDERRWVAGYRHGEELLLQVDELLHSNGVGLESLSGIVVGTGPGAFTGMRVGIATAKALARGLAIPIAGVPTSSALLAGVRPEVAAATASGGPAGAPVLLLPAGPSDRVMVVGGKAVLVKGGEEPELPPHAVVVAVDLPGRAPDDALARGDEAERALGPAMLRLGAEKLAAGGEDVALLGPEYVTLPRGVGAVKGEVRWSHDRP